ncbi:Arf-GAP with GTPase, ANK repeat and PH domain-containing protein 2, partial [Cichlidogyrus casuarinus]
YERKEFLPPLPYPDCPLQQQLIDAIAREDTRQVILCLAKATPDTVNAPYSRQDPRAAIHIAATLGNIVYLQLLLWYNGDPSVVDHEGRNAFFYAHCSEKYECAEFLLRNGCTHQHVPMPFPAANSLSSESVLPPPAPSSSFYSPAQPPQPSMLRL